MPASLYWRLSGGVAGGSDYYGGIGTSQNECLKIKPSTKPNGMNEDYWNARNKVKISIPKFFKWVNGKWSVNKQMSGFYQTEYTGGQTPHTERTEHASTSLIFMEQGPINMGKTQNTGEWHRENKCPKSNETEPVPVYLEGTCNEFNLMPVVYGKRPDDDLKKLRYNVCFPGSATGWFETSYKRTGVGPYIYCNGTPDPASLLSGQTNSSSHYWTAAGVASDAFVSGSGNECPVYLLNYTVKFYSRASFGVDISESWIDPEKNEIYPSLYLFSEYPSSGWEGLFPKDSTPRGSGGKHKTKTTIKVDGVDIPAGTTWSASGTSGEIDVSYIWSVEERQS